MIFYYILVMALVTYFIRMLPFVLFRKKITNIYVKSFLHYVPYAVLGAMTVPGVFYSTGNIKTAIAGFAVAFLFAFLNRSLLAVAIASSVATFLCGLLL